MKNKYGLYALIALLVNLPSTSGWSYSTRISDHQLSQLIQGKDIFFDMRKKNRPKAGILHSFVFLKMAIWWVISLALIF